MSDKVKKIAIDYIYVHETVHVKSLNIQRYNIMIYLGMRRV